MTTTSLLRPLSVAGAIVGLILTVGTGPASAAELTLADPVGDNSRPGLDIVNAQLENDDDTLAVSVSYRADRSGTTVVGIRARHRGTIRIVNLHDTDGPDRTLLLDDDARVRCAGLTGSWSSTSSVLTLTVPSTCLWHGNYGAIHPWVLTESLSSSTDVDFRGTRTWIARG